MCGIKKPQSLHSPAHFQHGSPSIVPAVTGRDRELAGMVWPHRTERIHFVKEGQRTAHGHRTFVCLGTDPDAGHRTANTANRCSGRIGVHTGCRWTLTTEQTYYRLGLFRLCKATCVAASCAWRFFFFWFQTQKWYGNMQVLGATIVKFFGGGGGELQIQRYEYKLFFLKGF